MRISTACMGRVGALVLACLAAGAGAQTASGAIGRSTPSTLHAGASGPSVPRDDVAFLQDAARNGLAEIEGGKLALEKGRNTQVKGFAQQMVDEHTKAQAELASFAQARRVALPQAPSMAQRARLKLLASAQGNDFDRRYAKTMAVAAHQDTLKLYERAAARGRDAEVRAFAAKALPTLQQHLQQAKDLQAAIEKDAKAAPASGARR